jgi:methylmalonyl-CoA carboxyltransferase small subunit
MAGAGTPPLDGNVDEGKVCRSPVAGVVVKINAQPGQQLQTNDLIMVLEAMKMETNITAPIAGKVGKINVAEGDGVKMNQVLVEFE